MWKGGRAALARERALWVGLLATFFFAGYFGIGYGVDPARAGSLRTAFDDAVPFVPEAVFAYVSVYAGLLLPLFTVRCPRLFRRVALSYAAVIGIALMCFAAFPVGAASLRPVLPRRPEEGFALWGVRLLYAIDPPTNLFPSIHLAIPTLAALAAWEARRVYGIFAWVLAAVVAVSICVLKQHYVVDGLAGFALAIAVWAALIRPQRGSFTIPRAWGWRGPLAYLGLMALGYLVAWLAYRSGLGWDPGGASSG